MRISDWSSDVCSSDLDQPITTHRSERSRQEAGGPAPKRHREQRHAGFAALRARSDTDDDNVVDGPGDIPASAAGIVVLERIGDCDSREGRDISARYAGIVGKRLSFRGALPAPGEAEADLARRWPWAPSAARFVGGRLALLRRAFMAGGEVGRLRLPPGLHVGTRSEERRGGKEGGSQRRYRWSPKT